MQLHGRLWRGTIAIRKRCRELAELAIQRELAPMQRELAALEKQEREQTASIDLWLAGLPQEEGSFLGWYHEDIKADVDGTNSIPSSSRSGCQP